MYGAEEVSKALTEHLAEWVPRRLTAITLARGALTKGAGNPAPRVYHPQQIAVGEVAIDDWPFVVVVVQDVPSYTQQTGEDDGSMSYLVRYNVEVFFYAKGHTFEATSQTRHRITQAGVEALLIRQSVGGNPLIRVDGSTVRSSYSGVAFSDAVAATIGAGRINLQLVVDENMESFIPVIRPAAPGWVPPTFGIPAGTPPAPDPINYPAPGLTVTRVP